MTTTATPERPAVRTFAVAAPVEVSGRNVSGVVVPWDVPSRTYGSNSWKQRDIFLPHSIRVLTAIPTPLLECHEDQRYPVGASTAWEDREDGLHMTFTLATTPRGEEALTLFREGICAGFSVGVGGLDESFNEDTGEWMIAGGELLHVGHVGSPKYPGAKADRVFDMSSGDRPAPKRSVKATWPLPGDQRIAGLEAEVKRLKLARHMDRLEALRVGS